MYLRYDLFPVYHCLPSLLQPSVERRQEVIREGLRKGRENIAASSNYGTSSRRDALFLPKGKEAGDHRLMICN